MGFHKIQKNTLMARSLMYCNVTEYGIEVRRPL